MTPTFYWEETYPGDPEWAGLAAWLRVAVTNHLSHDLEAS